MLEYSFEQLVDLDRVRSLLQAHHKVSGICSAILDLEQNILVAEGWENICTYFHRVNPFTCARCLESNVHITHRLLEVDGGCREIKCKNGLWDIAMPVIIGGSMVATFFIGQFFYDDEEVDETFFRVQAAEFGFDEEAYIEALRKVPVFSRGQIRNVLDFYRELIQVLAESGVPKLKLVQEMEERNKAEKALVAREREFRSLAENHPDNIVRWDTRGRYLYINPTHERALDVSARDCIGKEIPQQYTEVKAAVLRVATTARAEYSIREEVMAKGAIELHNVSLVPEFDEDGRIVSVLGIGRNMTAFYHMQDTIAAREQEYRSLAESSPDFIVRYDLEGRHLYLNTALVRRLGLSTAGEVIGQRASEVWPDGRFSAIEQATDCAMETGVIQTVEVSVPGVKGEVVSDHILIIPERNVAGQIIGAIAFGRDITERKRIETEIQNKNRELERFTYTVSHDLKSPLITISGFAGAICSDLASGRNDRIDKDLQRICNAADKMMTLLDDLLLLSRVGRVINPPGPVDMTQLVTEVVDNLSFILQENAVQVSVQSGLPTVSCDRQRILEVLQNLIENAVQYRGNQSELRVQIGLREEGQRQVFFVQDNGVGIAPKYHQHIFGLFNRLNTQIPGNGVGLSLVKRVIEEHGGSVWVESEGTGTGSTFCFSVN